MFERIPEELKRFNSWVLWRYEQHDEPKPRKVPYSAITGKHADPTDASTWSSFTQAFDEFQSQSFNKNFDGIGFVLSDADPYSIIDLDDTEGDNEAFELQKSVFQHFSSYSELSPSGNGVHIIVKGKLPPGRRRRKCIEVYCTQRFMTMTGNAINDLPIAERQELLGLLVEHLGKGIPQAAQGRNEPQRYDDNEICNRAAGAVNGQKFIDLYNGVWNGSYPSQSEADQALINIIVFYTQNYEQIARIFRSSALGKREKAQRHSYLFGKTDAQGNLVTLGMVQKAFDKMIPPVDIDHLRNEVEQMLNAPAVQMQHEEPVAYVAESGNYQPNAPLLPPPGLLGDIAKFIYDAAPRPVPEIALAGAIGLMAGICGRAYNISGTGLNQYVLLLARTGSGKEAIANGINKLMREVKKTIPVANEFVGPSAIASEQALVKYFAKSRSFVSIWGEFGMLLSQMHGQYAPAHMVGLRRTLLDLYNKSGHGNELGAGIWADGQKNTAAVQAPAFSILGESTPEKFYSVVNEDLISEGFLPRFFMIEYHGGRVPLNENSGSVQPSRSLVEHLASLCNQALVLNQQNNVCTVGMNPEAKELLDGLNRFADKQMNSAGDKAVVRELWNRAHIKALKLAALIAVGVNPYNPVVDKECAIYAGEMIVNDINNLNKRFETGEAGHAEADESKQVELLRRIFADYVRTPFDKLPGYAQKTTRPDMHFERVIPHSYISQKVLKMAAFRNDRLKASNALSRALKLMIDNGDIAEMGNSAKQKFGNVAAKLYVIANAKMMLS